MAKQKTQRKKRSTKKKVAVTPEAKVERVVFAFRLTEAERDTIHKAAGPRGASQFVLGAALAAASGDKKRFDDLVAHAASQR